MKQTQCAVYRLHPDCTPANHPNNAPVGVLHVKVLKSALSKHKCNTPKRKEAYSTQMGHQGTGSMASERRRMAGYIAGHNIMGCGAGREQENNDRTEWGVGMSSGRSRRTMTGQSGVWHVKWQKRDGRMGDRVCMVSTNGRVCGWNGRGSMASDRRRMA
eukprot:1159338-Pelagomonas_calceolata.AAC.13